MAADQPPISPPSPTDPPPAPAPTVGGSPALPLAVLEPHRSWSWFWLLPVVTAVLAAALAWQSWSRRGLLVSIQLDDGYGLKAGDAVRFRGIQVGVVAEVGLADDLGSAVAMVALDHHAAACARAGSLFWVVRPRLGLGGIAGLETIVGARYLGVLPGSGPPLGHFVALSDAPAADAFAGDGLDITVQADRRGSLRIGAPVLYRQVTIGSVVSVGLARDASAVEARLHIHAPYVGVVRAKSRFWDAGHLEIQAGLTGFSMRLDSLENLAGGAVAVATPPDGGDRVSTGHRFLLAQRADDEWLRWKPTLLLDYGSLPTDTPLPRPLRATLSTAKTSWWSGKGRSEGWLLAVSGGLLGPAELLSPPKGAKAELEVTGERYAISVKPLWEHAGIALLPISPAVTPWPRERLRPPGPPEDVLVVADPASEPLEIAAARLTAKGDAWLVDPALSLSRSWHGGAVVAARDGCVIGVYLAEGGQGRVALLPTPAAP